jgi:hypothetical protein
VCRGISGRRRNAILILKKRVSHPILDYLVSCKDRDSSKEIGT